MSVQITYFVHGTTTDNEQNISSGWFDVGLSELGVKQSVELREKIKDKKFDVVFSSDLKRAVDSAKLTFENTVQIVPDARLRECNYGAFNAKSSDVVEPRQPKMIYEKFPNGESYEDVKVRIQDFLEFLKKNYAGKCIAIVAHKAPQLALDVLLKGKTWERAFAEDWRHTKAWQPGWDYQLSTVDIEVCPICRRSYSDRNPKVQYHLQYAPVGKFINACRSCNHAEYLSRHWKRYLSPWQWYKIRLVRKFARENKLPWYPK